MLFKGRSNRAAYWLSFVLVIVMFAAISYFVQTPLRISEALVAIIAVPRLHDIGKSGWWAGGAILAEIVFAVTVTLTLPKDTAELAFGVIVLVFAGVLIWLGSVRGDATSNRYGAPPSGTFGWTRE